MNISELLQLYDSCFIHFFLLNRSLLLQRNQNEIEIMKTSNPVLQEIKKNSMPDWLFVRFQGGQWFLVFLPCSAGTPPACLRRSNTPL